MGATHIKYSIDLIVRVIDTATGKLIPSRDYTVYKNGEEVKVFVKEVGNYIFMNTGRDNFTLTVKIKNYYDKTVEVDYSVIDENLPQLDLFFVPDESYETEHRCKVLRGQTEGIESIDAVLLNNPEIRLKEYDERKKQITVFNPHYRVLDNIHYGLIAADGKSFEDISVTETGSETTMKIDQPLAKEAQINFPLSRIIFGKISDGGEYLLRVRDDITGGRFLVRQIVQGEERFSIWEP